MEKKGDPNFHKPSEKNNHFHVQYKQKQKVLGEWRNLPAFYITMYIILHSIINNYDNVMQS